MAGMKADVKEQWLKALRSGDYQQGEGVLRKKPDDGAEEFCCLGVLCDLAVKSGLDIRIETFRNFDNDATKFQYDGFGSYLPPVVRDWAGLDEPDPHVRDDEATLASMNDDGKPFVDIAAVIEEQL